MSQVTATEGSDAALAGELGDIGVQIHPVAALQFQDDVFFLELGEAVSYLPGEFRLGFCSPESGATAAGRPYSGASGGRDAQPDSSVTRDHRSKKPERGGASERQGIPRRTSGPRTDLALLV